MSQAQRPMHVIGMISGTSADGIEAIVAEVSGQPPSLAARVVAARSTPFPPDLQRRIHAIAGAGPSDAEAICRLDAELGERFAWAATELVADVAIGAGEVDLIGSHGQTIWHAVRADGSVEGTLQVGDPAVIAERTGITTISHFRSRDVAAGGQGAPLVGYVDWLLFRHATEWRAIQNIGGIANVTLLPPLDDEDSPPLTFDTGPGNVLIDCLVTLLSGGRETFDRDGALAASGGVDDAWLTELLRHPYYGRLPPKTTGRELFGPDMASELLAEGRARGLADADIVATITALTADAIRDAYVRFAPRGPSQVFVAGGGTRNPVIMARLTQDLAEASILTHEALGIASHQKEALVFAVLAYETWHGRPGSLPELTGVRHPVVLGHITPGHATTAMVGRPDRQEPERAADRGSGRTEATNPRTTDIDLMSSADILAALNREDATVPAAVAAVLPRLARAVDDIVERLRAGGRLIYVGAGTSGRLAMLDAVECVPTFGTPPEMVQAVVAGGTAALTASIEGAEDDAEAARRGLSRLDLGPADTLVGVAASGTTPFVTGALLEARLRGALTVAISCNEPAPILDVADHAISVATGPEAIAGSTRLKAGTAQKLVLNMISTTAMIRLGRVHGNRMIDIAIGNTKLRARAVGIVSDLVGIDEVAAERLLEEAGLEVKTAVLMGRSGLDAPAARRVLAQAGGLLREALAQVGTATADDPRGARVKPRPKRSPDAPDEP